jgi:hypothetical protein
MGNNPLEGPFPAQAMRANFWPLSGDVEQDILPWTWWLRFVGQWGLVNINLGRTAAPDLERQILDKVGSYGRQLGRVSEALQAVVEATLVNEDGKFDRAKLSDEQIAAPVNFKKLLDAVEELKSG